MNMDIKPKDKCLNMYSYGEICVGCNMCGRFNKETMWDCRYDYYVECIQTLAERLLDVDCKTSVQQKNIASDIVYYGTELKKCIGHLEFEGDKENDRKTM